MTRVKISKGFTLVEMMVVITIVGILLAVVIPGFKSILNNQRVKSASFELFTSLTLARSEAIKRNTDVTITPTTTSDWESGWSIAAGSTTLKNQAAISGVVVSGAPASVTYKRTGRISNTTSPAFQVDVSPADSTQIRCIKIELSGLPRISKGACS
jgi:type IV fimbrial biogenesis protein FimT